MPRLTSCVCSSYQTIISTDIQHNNQAVSVRADSSILEEIQVMWSQNYARHRDTTHVCSKHRQPGNHAMQCRVIELDTTYTFYEIETRKEIKKKRKQRRQIEREKEKRKNRGNKLSCPPPQGMWQTFIWKERAGEKKKEKTPLLIILVIRVRLRTKG